MLNLTLAEPIMTIMNGARDRRSAARRWKLLIAAKLSLAGYCAAIIYCVTTWSGPNRPAMVGMYSVGLLLGVVSVVAALRRVPATASYALSLTMLAATVVIVTACTYWDGGAGSPVALGFLIPALFAASSTARLGLLIGVEAVVIGAYLAVAAVGEYAPPGFVFLYVSTMLGVVVVCAAQARTLARQRAQLRYLAEHDPLTGALNRRGLARWAQAQTRLPAVICLDLDNFKKINDTLGHAAGDDLLQWVVRTVREQLRPHDAIARIGGDEFVIGLVDADPPATWAIAERVREALSHRTGVSPGWACPPDDGDTFERLVQVADQRLYRHKQQNKSGTADHAERVAHGETLTP